MTTITPNVFDFKTNSLDGKSFYIAVKDTTTNTFKTLSINEIKTKIDFKEA